MNAQVPQYMRSSGGWYEEDVDWSIPFVVFKQPLAETKSAAQEKLAMDTFRAWKPDMYERYYDVTLSPGESYVKDERSWKEEHKTDFQVRAAWGSGQTVRIGSTPYTVPSGYVAVVARPGGRDNQLVSQADEAYFLIPEGEYETRGCFGYVVDPSIYPNLSQI